MSASPPFGPQLIGETEKALRALLRRALAGRLTEQQWFALRLALSFEGSLEDDDGLAAAITARAHVEGGRTLVADLRDAGLVDDGKPTDAGRELVARVQLDVDAVVGPIWDGLPAADVEAAGRALREVASRARAGLAA